MLSVGRTLRLGTTHTSHAPLAEHRIPRSRGRSAPVEKAGDCSGKVMWRSRSMDDEPTSGIERAVFGAIRRDNLDG